VETLESQLQLRVKLCPGENFYEGITDWLDSCDSDGSKFDNMVASWPSVDSNHKSYSDICATGESYTSDRTLNRMLSGPASKTSST